MEDNKLVSNKKGLIKGLLWSFGIFLICWFFNSLFIGIVAVFTLGIINFSDLALTSPFFYAILVSIPFLIINSLILRFTKKNENFKKGLKFGYLFMLIFFVMAFSSYSQITNLQSAQRSRIIENEKVKNGDVSVCDKMPLTGGISGQVPSLAQLKDNCYKQIIDWAVNSTDASNCDRLKNDLPSFNSCVLQVAQNTQNPQICSKLNTDVLVKNCNSLINKK